MATFSYFILNKERCQIFVLRSPLAMESIIQLYKRKFVQYRVQLQGIFQLFVFTAVTHTVNPIAQESSLFALTLSLRATSASLRPVRFAPDFSPSSCFFFLPFRFVLLSANLRSTHIWGQSPPLPFGVIRSFCFPRACSSN